MKKTFTLVLLAFFLMAAGYQANAQTVIAAQDFEGMASDNWSYTVTPAPYNSGGFDVWDTVSSVGTIASASSGTYFWGMRDLDNPNGGGPFWHYLTFDSIDVSGYTNVTVSFDYNSVGYDTAWGDTLAFWIEFNSDTTWNTMNVGAANTNGWSSVTISVPAGSQWVRVRFGSVQNGGSDYAGVDNLKVTGTSMSSSITVPAYQDFEGASTDNWTYTEYPAAYNSGGFDVWDTVMSIGTISAPSSGSYMWGMRDLDNPNGGGPFWHYLTFDTVNIMGMSNLQLSFDYQTIGFDASDSIAYWVEFNNGTTWNSIQLLNTNTNAWTTVNITVPANSNWVRLRLGAKQNGGSDYAAFDNVKLEVQQLSGDTTKPEVINGVFLSPTSVMVVFSEPVTFASAQNTANYSFDNGISVTGAILNPTTQDTVLLTLSPGFSDGVLYTANISGIVDTSSNANMMDPFTTSFYVSGYTGNDLIISEIYYSQPSGGIQDIDYFEVYNKGNAVIHIGGMQIVQGVGYDRNDTNIALNPGDFLVFAENIDSFMLAFPSVSNVIEWGFGSLSGGGEDILIVNSFGDTVSYVDYQTSSPWPSFSNTEAIELCDLLSDYTDPANWYYAGNVSSTVAATLYGSPGSANSCAAPPVIPTYTIATVRTVDADGVADSLGVYCALEGIVYGVDLRGNGYQFTIIDSTDGINVFSFSDVDNYVVNQGDMIRVVGEIDQYRGLIEIKPDSITVLSTGHCIPFPRVVTTLDESTESRYIEFKNVMIADPSQWPTGSGNVQIVTENGDTIVMRIDSDTHIQDSILSAPSGKFNLIGIGGQYSSSTPPHLDGYQIFPMFDYDIDTNEYNPPADIQFNELMINNAGAVSDPDGDFLQWIEIYNAGNADVDFTGFFISYDPLDVYLHRFPRCNNDLNFPAGDWKLLWANSDKGPLYIPFALDSANGFLGLYTQNGQIIDTLDYSAAVTTPDYSYGYKDNDKAMGNVTFEVSSPAASNSLGVIISVINPGVSDNPLSVFPNPATDKTVTFNKPVNISVYNIAGQLMFNGRNVTVLNIDRFDKGVYLIKTDEGELVKLIVK